ncbi:MAG: transcriptional regulator [Kibdelosporangium sp.]
MADDGLEFDPRVVPALRTVFADALAKVDRQIELADAELRMTPWAGDPISEYAGERFNARSVDTEASAVRALRSYRDDLDAVVAKLTKAGGDYRDSEEDKDVTMNQQGEE